MSDGFQQIKTFTRIRPVITQDELKFSKKNKHTILSSTNQDEYMFDAVFDEKVSNQEIYLQTTMPILQHNFKGYNSCVLAYGQTASGKTYTMKGTNENPGIIPLVFKDIFAKLKREKAMGKFTLTYFQIYNENVIDLLNQRQNHIIELREDHRKNIVLTQITQIILQSEQMAMDQFLRGQQRRKFASNNVNNMSSRSHAVLRISLHVVYQNCTEFKSHINLVDLAGSQGANRTKAEGLTKAEGQNINKSILALSKVIKAMSQKMDDKKQKNGNGYVNFRDSKLTRILQTSLCSNSRSTIICTVNPSRENYQQSLNTLKFGKTAAHIKIQAFQQIIKTQILNSKMKSAHKGLLQFLPSEKLQLQELRKKVAELNQQNSDLVRECRNISQKLLNQEDRQMNLQTIMERMKNQMNQRVKSDQSKIQQFYLQRQAYEARLHHYEEEISNLYDKYKRLRVQYVQVQKNQKSLLQELNSYQNQVKNLNLTIADMRNKINEQITRTIMKPFSQIKVQKPNITEVKRNPFSLGPYKQVPNRTSPSKLRSITQLNIQLIDLCRKVGEFSKANIEIAEQNDNLRRQLQQNDHQSNSDSAFRLPNVSSKINPSNSQFNEIRRLNRKINQLKRQLKSTEDKLKKQREIVKIHCYDNLQKIEEFQQWYNQKHLENYYKHQDTQTQTITSQSSQANFMKPIMQINQFQNKQNKIVFSPKNYPNDKNIFSNTNEINAYRESIKKSQNPQKINGYFGSPPKNNIFSSPIQNLYDFKSNDTNLLQGLSPFNKQFSQDKKTNPFDNKQTAESMAIRQASPLIQKIPQKQLQI